MRPGLYDFDGITSDKFTRLNDPQVRSGTAVLGESFDPALLTHKSLEYRTRYTRSRHFKQRRADPPPVADTSRIDINASGGQVLTEVAGFENASSHVRPVVKFFTCVRVNRLIRSTVIDKVGDLIALKSE